MVIRYLQSRRTLLDAVLFFGRGDAPFHQADVVGRRQFAAAGFEEIGDLDGPHQIQQLVLQVQQLQLAAVATGELVDRQFRLAGSVRFETVASACWAPSWLDLLLAEDVRHLGEAEHRPVLAHELRSVLAMAAAPEAAVHVAFQADVDVVRRHVQLQEVPGRHVIEHLRPADQHDRSLGIHLDAPQQAGDHADGTGPGRRWRCPP